MRILFISDLHLHETRPEITNRFFKFLNDEAKEANALYILGDFFEAWIGDDNLSLHDQKVFKALETYAKRIPTYFMPGNRDFLLQPDFLKRYNITYLKDPSLINCQGKPVLLMHGDTLCLKDIAYQRFRSIVRLSFVQWLFLHFPFIIRKKIALGLRQNSNKNYSKNKIKDLSIYDVEQNAVEQIMQAQNADVLIHGHTHKPGIHTFVQNGIPLKRVVLGDWGQKSTYLEYNDGEFDLKEIHV